MENVNVNMMVQILVQRHFAPWQKHFPRQTLNSYQCETKIVKFKHWKWTQNIGFWWLWSKNVAAGIDLQSPVLIGPSWKQSSGGSDIISCALNRGHIIHLILSQSAATSDLPAACGAAAAVTGAMSQAAWGPRFRTLVLKYLTQWRSLFFHDPPLAEKCMHITWPDTLNQQCPARLLRLPAGTPCTSIRGGWPFSSELSADTFIRFLQRVWFGVLLESTLTGQMAAAVAESMTFRLWAISVWPLGHPANQSHQIDQIAPRHAALLAMWELCRKAGISLFTHKLSQKPRAYTNLKVNVVYPQREVIESSLWKQAMEPALLNHLKY